MQYCTISKRKSARRVLALERQPRHSHDPTNKSPFRCAAQIIPSRRFNGCNIFTGQVVRHIRHDDPRLEQQPRFEM